MRVVYIAGKFRGKNSWEIEQNIRKAEELALEAWRAGFAVICPHTNTRFFQGVAPDYLWLKGDIAIMAKCDAVLTVDNWRESEGAKEEVHKAHELDIPVFHALKDMVL